MATKKKTSKKQPVKRGRGRPPLTKEQLAAREERTKVAFHMNPYQLALLDNWIEEQELLEGRRYTRASAGLHLVISKLRGDKSKEDMDAIVEKVLGRPYWLADNRPQRVKDNSPPIKGGCPEQVPRSEDGSLRLPNMLTIGSDLEPIRDPCRDTQNLVGNQ